MMSFQVGERVRAKYQEHRHGVVVSVPQDTPSLLIVQPDGTMDTECWASYLVVKEDA